MNITYNDFSKSYSVTIDGDVWNQSKLYHVRYWLDDQGFKINKDYFIQIYQHEDPVNSTFIFYNADLAIEFALIYA